MNTIFAPSDHGHFLNTLYFLSYVGRVSEFEEFTFLENSRLHALNYDSN